MGKLKSNLISLETFLRFYILKKEGDDKNFIEPSCANVGDLVKINAFTNYDTLNELIDRYNRYQSISEKIDSQTIISIRDLLAHGRAYSLKEGSPLIIIKYERENQQNKGFVKMTHKEILDTKWFNDANTIIHNLLQKIAKELT